METTTIIIIVGVLMFINLLLNNKRINDLRSLTGKMKEYAIKDFDHLTKQVEETRTVLTKFVGIKDIQKLNNNSAVFLETVDGEVMYMDLCKMNKQFVPLQKVGKSVPSKDLRFFFNGVEYHYTPVVDECDCEF